MEVQVPIILPTFDFEAGQSVAVPGTVVVELLDRLPTFVIVGMPASQVRETAERVRSAIAAAGFDFPKARAVVTLLALRGVLSPTGLDLPIALAILAASGQLTKTQAITLRDTVSWGELSLGGAVRPVRGSLTVLAAAARASQHLLLPPDSGSLVPLGTEVHTLVEAVHRLDERLPIPPTLGETAPLAPAPERILVIYGTRGAARFARSLVEGLTLPPEEALGAALVHDAAGLVPRHPDAVPFRAPHHTVSAAGMLGSRTRSHPGEVHLARHGVLLLDEFDEFYGTREVILAPGALAGVKILVVSFHDFTRERMPEDLAAKVEARREEILAQLRKLGEVQVLRGEQD